MQNNNMETERNKEEESKNKFSQFLKIILTSLIAALACTGIIYAATTVGSNISTGGTLDVTGVATFTTASSTGIVKFANINSDTGAISFGNENLSTTGTLTVTGLTTLGNASTTVLSVSGDTYITGVLSVTGNLIFTTASSTGIVKFANINSDTGAISFGDENLTTTGNLTAGKSLAKEANHGNGTRVITPSGHTRMSIENFDDLTGPTFTDTAVTVTESIETREGYFIEGTGSLKANYHSGTASAQAWQVVISSPITDMRGKIFRFAIKTGNYFDEIGPVTDGDFEVCACSGVLCASDYKCISLENTIAEVETGTQQITEGEWQYVQVSQFGLDRITSSSNGTVDWTSIVNFMIKTSAPASNCDGAVGSGTDCTMWIDDVHYVIPPKTAAVTFRHDDGIAGYAKAETIPTCTSAGSDCIANDILTLTTNTFVNGDVVYAVSAQDGMEAYTSYSVCAVNVDDISLDQTIGCGGDCATCDSILDLTSDTSVSGSLWNKTSNLDLYDSYDDYGIRPTVPVPVGCVLGADQNTYNTHCNFPHWDKNTVIGLAQRFEISPHGYLHMGAGTMNDLEWAQEITLGKAALETMGGVTSYYVYPYGGSNNTTKFARELIRENYEAAFAYRDTGPTMWNELTPHWQHSGLTWSYGDKKNSDGSAVSTQTELLAFFKDAADYVYTYGGWLVYAMHNIVLANPVSTDIQDTNLDSLVDYVVNTKKLPVVTYGDMVKAMGSKRTSPTYSPATLFIECKDGSGDDANDDICDNTAIEYADNVYVEGGANATVDILTLPTTNLTEGHSIRVEFYDKNGANLNIIYSGTTLTFFAEGDWAEFKWTTTQAGGDKWLLIQTKNKNGGALKGMTLANLDDEATTKIGLDLNYTGWDADIRRRNAVVSCSSNDCPDTLGAYLIILASEAAGGADAMSIADGITSQEKKIILFTDNENVVVTPDNFLNGTSITFDDAGDSATITFFYNTWVLTNNNGITVNQ